ncbi:hypothetical protein PENANT_c001G08473 [Penicillium antarcticum]|uniref:Uncharacterized protein n=1 Tax=Penicillium antarcticum TaxID=416450 RepID=A0A1V6QNG6_9EURO|nr:hypothetical protein PENANT_c001G08473 [Penicillium antarcticum]
MHLLFESALCEDFVSSNTLAEQDGDYMTQHLGKHQTNYLHWKNLDCFMTNRDAHFGSCSYICPSIQAMFSIEATDFPLSIKFREASAHQESNATFNGSTVLEGSAN